ncbi:AraC family transcriptional regulator [Actinomadura fibrosa]|uniref:AraC family ligand binding domain-containing protein n=1 Tax=Actinomadura fibrosa TaxID=111802 RepID=A0ABW2XLW6_9ACTN|nr:AraC family transcriptional regulator [Actinomadura fibrosa]
METGGSPATGARMWRAEDLGGLELFKATLTAFDFSPHAHEEFFIALTEDGLASPTYRGDTHTVGPGDLIVLNPDEVHGGGPPAAEFWAYRALYPGPSLMDAIAAEFPRTASPEFRGGIVRDPDAAARLRRFHRLTEAASSTLERESALTEALVLLIGRHAAPPREPRATGREPGPVRLSRIFLEEHAAENIALRALAQHAGLSPFHLCRVFRASVGMSPHAYQTHLRIRRARELLRSGMPITEVAVASGFYDQAHLARHFKRIVGLPPGRYARSGR